VAGATNAPLVIQSEFIFPVTPNLPTPVLHPIAAQQTDYARRWCH